MLKTSTIADSVCGMTEPARAVTDEVEWPRHQKLRARSWIWGFLAGALLFLAYVGILSAANSLEHAVSEFLRLWYWMVPLVSGFALQVGLFTYARGAAHADHGLQGKGVVASGGASTISMAACCAHHVTDVLPLFGLASAGLFLSTYQNLFLLVGIVSNALGILYLLSVIGRHRLAPSQGSILSLLPAHAWRPMLVSGGVASAITLALGVWAFAL